MKPTIKYLGSDGKYHYATVKDIGDIESLKTNVKTSLVDAINSLLGHLPDDLMDLIGGLEADIDGIISENELTNANMLQLQQNIDQSTIEFANKLESYKKGYEEEIELISQQYDEKVALLNQDVEGINESLDATELELTELSKKLNKTELNVTEVTRVIDEVNGVLASKVDATRFDNLEQTVTQQGTDIEQTKDQINLKASQADLDLATQRVSSAEAKIELNAEGITSAVKRDEMRKELDALDIYAPNLLENTRDWDSWTSKRPANAYVKLDTYQHTKIQEQIGSGDYLEYVVDELEVGETYTASVWGLSESSTAKPVFMTDASQHTMKSRNGDQLLTSSMSRYSVSFVAGKSSYRVGVTTSGSTSSSKSRFAGLKIEKGSENSGWQAHESDTSEILSSTRSEVKQMADQITSYVEEQTRIGEDVEKHSTSIDQLSDSITAQAESIKEIEGNVSSNTAELAIQSDKIATKVEQIHVDEAIKDIKLDTRNYIPNSNFKRVNEKGELEDWANVNDNFYVEAIGDKNWLRINRSGLSSNMIASATTSKFPAKNGDNLVLGFDFSVDNTSTFDNDKIVAIDLLDINDTRVSFKEYTLSELGVTMTNRVEKRVNIRHEIDRADVDKAQVRLMLNKNGFISFANISVQKGSIGEGGWIPAPEDNEKIQAKLQTEIEQTASQISLKADSTRVDTLEGQYQNISAEISIQSDKIESTVSDVTELQTNVSNVTQTADSISSQVGTLSETVSNFQKNYIWVAYADDASGSGISSNPDGKTYIGFAFNKSTEKPSKLVASDYDWQKSVGKDGQSGKTPQVHIAYANSDDGRTNFTTGSPNGHKYMGTYVDYITTDSPDPTKYNWSLIRGADGLDGKDGYTPVKGVDYFDGKKGQDGTSSYLWVKYSKNSNGNPMMDTPQDALYIGVATTTVSSAPSGYASYKWSLIKGKDGVQGETGKDGKASYLHIRYSNDGGKTFTSNDGETVGSWIGTYVDFVQDDSTSVSSYTWNKVRGEDGKDGSDGVSVSSIVEYYLATSASSNVTHATSGWTKEIQTISSSKKYLWNYEETKLSNGYSNLTTPVIIGTYGKDGSDGSDGRGISDIVEYYLATSANSGVTTSTSGWSTTMKPTTTTNKYLWNYEVITYTDGNKKTINPIIIGTHGATGSDGKGVKSTAVTYQNGTSGTSAPTGTWSSSVVSPIKGQYLWTKTVITYTDNSTVTTYSVAYNATDGQKGDAGRGISKTTITYQQSTSGSTTPTGSWLSSVPAPVKGRYLWTRTVIAYTDGTNSTSYSTSYYATDGQRGEKGEKGDTGKGIVSTTVTYKNHTNGTTAPTGTWSNSVPTPVKGQYLWTRTVAKYSDNSEVTTYSVSYHATDGQKGDKGDAGTGVSTTTVHYQLSTSGTTTPTGSWSTSIPSPVKGQYLWTRTVINYTNGTKSTAYSTSYYATDGQKGADGRSVSSITEEYGTSTNATTEPTSWSTTRPAWKNGQYIWTRSKIVYANPSGTVTTKPVNVTGEAGATGASGKGIKSTDVTYQNGASGTSAPTGSWSGSVPTPVKGQYLWTRTISTYTDNSKVTTYSVAYNATDGKDGDKGDTGTGISSTTVHYQQHTSGSTAPTGTWSTSVPSPVKGRYLWTRTVVKYTDGKSSTSYSTSYYATDGQKGADGKSITKVDVEYALHTSSTTAPTSGWQTTSPNWELGLFIWQRSKVTYSSGNPTYTTPHCIETQLIDGVANDISNLAMRDKTEILSGTEIFTDKADDSVVHVDIDGKSVGGGSGKNIAHGANNVEDWSDYINTATVTYPQGSSIRVENKVATGTTIFGIQQSKMRLKLTSDKTYVMSYMVRGNVSAMNYVYVMNSLGANQSISATGNIAVNSEWNLVWHRFKPTTVTNDSLYSNLMISVSSAPVGAWFEVKNIQLEESSTATPYEPPAPDPDYPIEIHSVNDFDVVSSAGRKNLHKETSDKWTEKHLAEGVWFFQQGTDVRLEIGKTYTFSIIVEKISNDNVDVNLAFGIGNKDSFNWDRGSWGNRPRMPLGEKVSTTFTVTEEDLSKGYEYFSWRLRNERLETTIRFKEVKLEESPYATPYSPAPEDIQPDTLTPTLYKTNILLSEPLRSVGDVKDRLFRDSDGLWKVERNVGEVIFNGDEAFTLNTYPMEGYYLAYTIIRPISESAYPKWQSTHFKGFSNIHVMSEVGDWIQQAVGNKNLLYWIKLPTTLAFDEKSFRDWLLAQKNNGDPLKILYELPLSDKRIETLSQSEQDKLNNLRSFKDSNYLYTIVDKTNISSSVAENLKPTLHAKFKSQVWYQDFRLSETSAQSHAKRFETAEQEKSTLDERYNEIYKHGKLSGGVKTALYNAKVAYNTKFTALETALAYFLLEKTDDKLELVETAYSGKGGYVEAKTSLEVALDNAQTNITEGITNDSTGRNMWILTRYVTNSVSRPPKTSDFRGLSSNFSRLIDDFTDNGEYLKYSTKSIYHATTYVYVESAKSISLTVSHDDSLSILLNGESKYGGVGIQSSKSISLSLKQGWNQIELLLEGVTATNYVRFNRRISELVDDMSCYLGGGMSMSQIRQLNDEIDMRVQEGEVISKINLSKEGIQISGDKIDITGQVTFSSFDTSTKNTINDKATKGEAQKYAGDAEGRAKSHAESQASGAESRAKSHADTKASTAETNAKNHAESKATDAERNAKDHASLISSVKNLDGTAKKFINPTSMNNRASSVSGYVIIRTPIMNGFMTKMKISGYNYVTGKTDISLDLGFYAYTASSILQRSFISNGDFPIKKVQIGRDSSGRAVIILGEANTQYSYPTISVDEAVLSYTNAPDSYKDGWSMSISKDLSGISSITNIEGYDTKSDISSAQSTANTAKSTAESASSSASTANSLLSDLSSDSKLTASEKKSVKLEWDAIVGEKPKIEAQANTYGITTEKNTYNSRYSTLNTYITPLLSNLSTTSSITGSTFRANFKNYYDARQDLLNAITKKAEANAKSHAESQASGAESRAKSHADGKASDAEKNAKKHADDKVDELEIGGRNLLLGSTKFVDRGGASSFTRTITEDGYLRVTSTGGGGYFHDNGIIAMASELEKELNNGDWYTFSVEARSSDSTGYLTMYANTRSYLRMSGTVSSEFSKQSLTLKWIKGNGFTVHMGYSGSSGTIEIRNAKLERGNKATGWSPAPEDVEFAQNYKTFNPVRYIRDWANGSTANDSNHWNEIQAIQNGTGKNVAKGRSVSTNGTLQNGHFAVDEVINTSWAGAGVGYKYLQIDLGSVYYDIEEIRMWRYYPDGRRYYQTKTEVSTDGVVWHPIFDSMIEGEYAESASGKVYPNTRAKSESLISSQEMLNRLGDSTSRTKINGGNITTGKIQSENGYSWISLDNGEFNFGNGGLIYSRSSGLTVNGKLSVNNLDGQIPKSRLDSTTQNQITAGNTAQSTLSSKASTWDTVTSKATPAQAQGYANTARDEAKKYVDENTGNLINNPAVSGTMDGWSGSGLSVVNQTFEGVSTKVLQASTSSNVQYYSRYFDVDPSKAYEVSMWFKKSVANASGYYLGLNGVNSSGSTVGFVQVSQSGSLANSNNTNFYFDYGTPKTDWFKAVGYIMPVGTSPSDLAKVGTMDSAIMKQNVSRIRVRFLNWNNGGTTRQLWVANPKVVEVDPNAVIYGANAKNTVDSNKSKWDTGANNGNSAKSTLDSKASLWDAKMSDTDVASKILADKKIKDTRATNQNPAWYYTNYPNQIVREFKNVSAMGVGTGTYGILTTDVPWSGSSGGSVKQTFRTNTEEFKRDGTTTSWTAWVNHDAMASNAKSKTDAWSWSGTTEINGAKIRTGTITANKIRGSKITALTGDMEINLDNGALTTGGASSYSTVDLSKGSFSQKTVNARTGGHMYGIKADETGFMIGHHNVQKGDAPSDVANWSVTRFTQHNKDLSISNDGRLYLASGDGVHIYGKTQIDSPVWIRGTASEKPFMVRGIEGSGGGTAFSEGDLYLNHVSKRVTHIGGSVHMESNTPIYMKDINGSPVRTIHRGADNDLHVNPDSQGDIVLGGVGGTSNVRANRPFYKSHGLSIASINATANSNNSWNRMQNNSMFLKSYNNAIGFVVGGTQNNRQAIIQVGHAELGFAQHTGNLYMNKFGGTVYFGGGISVTGTKNAVHVTREGVRATPAYETAESYLGDIGEDKTNHIGESEVFIEALFSDVVNTDIPYQVFIQSYGEGDVWVEKRGFKSFVVKSSLPNTPFAWELKAKRRGYENDRMVLDTNFDNDGIKTTGDLGGVEDSEIMSSRANGG